MVAKRKTIKPVQGHDTHPLRLFMPLGFYLHHTEVYREKTVYRGEVYYAELSPVIGSEQGGIRPVLILQNNTGNRHSPTTIIAPITSVQKKSSLPTHIIIDYDFLESVSVVLLEQIRTIDKERLSDCLGKISVQDMQRVEAAMAVSLGMRWRHDR